MAAALTPPLLLLLLLPSITAGQGLQGPGSADSGGPGRTVRGVEGQCIFPVVSKLISEQSKSYYSAGETTGVRCTEGYEPSVPVLRCIRTGAATDWDSDVTCIEQCRIPEGSKLISEQSKLYYGAGETTGVRCIEGYEPSEPVLRCVRRGAAIVWEPDVFCIGGPGSRTTEDPKTGPVQTEEGSSFTAFNAIQVAQIVVLLIGVTVTSLLCKRGTFQGSTTDSCEYVNTSVVS